MTTIARRVRFSAAIWPGIQYKMFVPFRFFGERIARFRWINTAIRQSTQIPFDGVPSEPEIFLQRTSRLTIAKK